MTFEAYSVSEVSIQSYEHLCYFTCLNLTSAQKS